MHCGVSDESVSKIEAILGISKMVPLVSIDHLSSVEPSTHQHKDFWSKCYFMNVHANHEKIGFHDKIIVLPYYCMNIQASFFAYYSLDALCCTNRKLNLDFITKFSFSSCTFLLDFLWKKWIMQTKHVVVLEGAFFICSLWTNAPKKIIIKAFVHITIFLIYSCIHWMSKPFWYRDAVGS